MQVTVDPGNRDKEPNHIPGKIQSHGFLLAVDEADFRITHISSNVSDFLSIKAEAYLNKHVVALDTLLTGNDSKFSIESTLKKFKEDDNINNPFKVHLDDKLYNLIISHSQKKILLEFEPSQAYKTEVELQIAIGKSFSEIISEANTRELLNRTVVNARQLTGFDRAMIYKFNNDGYGEVIAEAKNDHTDTLLGMHFPASDISAQARELYKRQLTRIIADVNDTTADILSYDTEPLDLSSSELRVVSPIHIQYLKNMHVQASFSISLVHGDDLWGLIACHNNTPKFIDYTARQACKLIGKILSYSYDFIRQSEERDSQKSYLVTQEKLFSQLREPIKIADALVSQQTTLKDVMDCAGAAFIHGGTIYRTGKTPDENDIRQIARWLKSSVNETIFCTNALAKFFEPASSFQDNASGLMVATVSKQAGEYIIWFRPEMLQQIQWAGNPEKAAEVTQDDSLTISPGTSFKAWSETIRGSSKPWKKIEQEFAQRILSEVTEAINQRSAETRLLNDELKFAYEELDKFSYTISHDLKNPLAIIKSYCEILEFNTALDEKSKTIVKKILSSAAKMNNLINEVLKYSRLGMENLEYSMVKMGPLLMELQTELPVVFNMPNLEFKIEDTPNVYGDPTMILQVFSNLLNNAIKYSSKTEKPSISVKGIDNGSETLYTVSDNGIGIDPSFHAKIFGLFARLHTVNEYEGTGVGLAIVKRMVEKHNGRIWLESEPGKGTTFYVAFPKPGNLN